MGSGNMFKRVKQMRRDGSVVGQLGKRLMKEGGSTASDTAKEEALAEVAEKKQRAAMGKAYDEAASRSMGTFKEKTSKPPAAASSPPMTEARKTAEFMEKMRMSPASTREAQSEGMKGPRMMKAPAELYDAVRSVVSPRTKRTDEEMNELTREVGRGMKKGGKVKCYAKGGSVSSASKRADGCATKGKTNCKIR